MVIMPLVLYIKDNTENQHVIVKIPNKLNRRYR